MLLLDKTGTITLGNRQATEFLPAEGVGEARLADAAQLSSLADETPEGRSIVVLAKKRYKIRQRDVHALGAHFVPFTAQTRMSGVNLNGRQIRKGAADAVEAFVVSLGGLFPVDVRTKQADVAVAMSSGTQAAKEAANLVDLDSNPTKLIETVEIGKQLLITRGNLTTFSIANDVAKYFAIIPAAFATTYPVLDRLNLMRLASPQSAILSAVIFNALIIIALIPLALRGVKLRRITTSRLLRDNLLIYGLGGVIVPFVGIKLIDLILQGLGLV